MKERTRKFKKARNGFADRLATLRGDRSQRRFAHEVQVFQQNVNRYENGTAPHLDFLIQVAQAEGVSLDWLILGVGRMKRRA
jgi:transcriptional regulator with XRE-family HTH domain